MNEIPEVNSVKWEYKNRKETINSIILHMQSIAILLFTIHDKRLTNVYVNNTDGLLFMVKYLQKIIEEHDE